MVSQVRSAHQGLAVRPIIRSGADEENVEAVDPSFRPGKGGNDPWVVRTAVPVNLELLKPAL